MEVLSLKLALFSTTESHKQDAAMKKDKLTNQPTKLANNPTTLSSRLSLQACMFVCTTIENDCIHADPSSQKISSINHLILANVP